uniref:Myb-like domain-containing protein n=1 Tax=Mola mola TaxID=94237 RepID=A0A3Q3WC41_MOLML
MFRRSRFSIRPNVGTAGRTAATPQESPPADQEASETSKVISDNNTATTVTDSKDGSDQNGEGTSSSSAIQRRKRFSVKPKVAPGRPSALARTTKSPVKAVSEVPVSDQDKPTVTSQNATTVPPQGLQSPRQRRPSEESKQAKVQPKPTLIPSDSSGPSVVAIAEDSLKQIHPSADSGKQLQGTSDSQSKEAPFKLADKSGLSPTSAAFSLSRLLNDPSDIQRLAKARKLRELLRKELHKEKVSSKYSLSAPGGEVEEEEEEEEEEAASAAAEEEQEEPFLVPQVKVAEDGSLIIDEESLTVEVQRAKGPNPAQDRDPIFERGSTTTYSSFRKGTYSKPWSSEETDMFFLAISMVGTDFSMICQLFPHRARSEIKNKFKKEERENVWRVDKAFSKYFFFF